MQYYIKLAALWSYPTACCSGKDCEEIPTTNVRETPDGYIITLTEHKMLLPGFTATYSIPYTDSRIKDSPDGVYHACISMQTMNSGQVFGARLICFFAPPKGF